MIAVVTGGPFGGWQQSIYARMLRYVGKDLLPETFQIVDSLEDAGDAKTAIVLDNWDSRFISQTLGRRIEIQKARGYRHTVGDQIIIPSYHPALLSGKMDYLPVTVWDFKTALRTDGQPAPKFPLEDLVLHPDPEQFQTLCAAAKQSQFVAFDLETPGKEENEEAVSLKGWSTTIVRASIAWVGASGRIIAVTFQWLEPYITYAKDLLAAPVTKLTWNGRLFDLPVMRLNEIPVNGRHEDVQDLYHFLQPTLPKALGAVSTIYAEVPEWKSLNNDAPELYSAMDAWATVKNYLGIKASHEKRGTWDLAQRHVCDIGMLLDEMHLHGVNYDQEQVAAYNAECDVELARLQAELNEDPELKPLRGYRPTYGDGTFGYKYTPKDTTGLVQLPFETTCSWCEGVGTCQLKNGPKTCIKCDGAKATRRWAEHLPFLPTSWQQVAKYFDSKGYQYESTDEDAIMALYRKHKDPLLLKFIEYRENDKKKGTYGAILGGKDGRVHSSFTLKPSTHRLSSVDPNMQNIPKEFKHVFIPSPGHKLIEVDLSSVEAVLTGFFAGDEEYIRRAKLGIHKIAMYSYLGHTLDFGLSDKEIKAILKGACNKHEAGHPECEGIKDLDEGLYRKIKTVIYGGNYLAGARTVYKKNPMDFDSEADAKKFLKFCQSLSPLIPAWQTKTCEQAARQHGLTNPFGYYCAFWDYEGGPAAVAFLPQSTVAAIMKEIMLSLCPELRSYLVLQVHDSLVFDVPEARLEWARAEITRVFTRSWPQLNGLSIGFEMKTGDSLAF